MVKSMDRPRLSAAAKRSKAPTVAAPSPEPPRAFDLSEKTRNILNAAMFNRHDEVRVPRAEQSSARVYLDRYIRGQAIKVIVRD
jgi:hypothetical protein